ncbi:MAG: ribonuclease R [Pseudomonadota bacterium]
MNETYSSAAILRILENANGPLPRRALFHALDIPVHLQPNVRNLLKSMARQGEITLLPGHRIALTPRQPVSVHVMVTGFDANGDLLVRSVTRDAEGDFLRFVIPSETRGAEKMAKDSNAIISMTPGQGASKITIVKILENSLDKLMGSIEQARDGWRIKSMNRKDPGTIPLLFPAAMQDQIKDGLVVSAMRTLRGEKVVAELIDILGPMDSPKLISHLSAYEAGLIDAFPSVVLQEAEKFTLPKDTDTREDLTDIPLVTIDGPDARDYDDAVAAQRDKEHPDRTHIIVAIADVAYYVRAGTALDDEARRRGNSTYFPDKVIPMLPETLSNDLCSLKPLVPRACMVAHMWINDQGKMVQYKFTRGMMKSAARLTYEQIQHAYNGQPDDTCTPLMDTVIQPLYAAYGILAAAREKRGALNIETIERQVIIDDRGEMIGVRPRPRFDSQKVIEEFMVLANVAAASALEDKKAPCVYRIHDKPAAERLANLSDFMKGLGQKVPDGMSLDGRKINALMAGVTDPAIRPLVSTLVLRTQAQARYDNENIGHFGLQLEKYAHFTSPIRRYADLLVHRSLIKAYKLGDGGLSEDDGTDIAGIAEHITKTERQSSDAERNATDRFTARFLADRVGAEFDGVISSVTRFGLFISLAEFGADGLLPMRSLPNDYYVHDERRQTLTGRRSGIVFRFGEQIRIRLAEVNALAGMLSFELAGTVTRAQPRNGAFNRDRSDRPRPPHNNDRRPPGRGRDDRPPQGRRDERPDTRPSGGDAPRKGPSGNQPSNKKHRRR